MANTGAIWQQAAHVSYHLAAQKEPYKNSLTLKECLRLFWWGGSGEWTISRELTHRAREPGRKTRQEIREWNKPWDSSRDRRQTFLTSVRVLTPTDIATSTSNAPQQSSWGWCLGICKDINSQCKPIRKCQHGQTDQQLNIGLYSHLTKNAAFLFTTSLSISWPVRNLWPSKSRFFNLIRHCLRIKWSISSENGQISWVQDWICSMNKWIFLELGLV